MNTELIKIPGARLRYSSIREVPWEKVVKSFKTIYPYKQELLTNLKSCNSLEEFLAADNPKGRVNFVALSCALMYHPNDTDFWFPYIDEDFYIYWWMAYFADRRLRDCETLYDKIENGKYRVLILDTFSELMPWVAGWYDKLDHNDPRVQAECNLMRQINKDWAGPTFVSGGYGTSYGKLPKRNEGGL